jgi:hypothetical protein
MDECYTTQDYRVGKPNRNSKSNGCLDSISYDNSTKILTITPLCGDPLSTLIGSTATTGATIGSDIYTVSSVYNADSGMVQFVNNNGTNFALDLAPLKAGSGIYYAGSGINISNTNTISLDTNSNPANYVRTISLNGGAPLAPNGGNLNLNVNTGGATGGVANQQDPITIVSTVADINALQAQDSSGSQLMQYVGVTGSLVTSFGSIYLVQGSTYSISDNNKISDLSSEVVASAVYTGDFVGVDSEPVPVRTRNQNGMRVFQIAFHRTAGAVVAGNLVSLKVNNLVVATLPLSTTGKFSKLFTALTVAEGDEYTFTAPNNPSLAGIVYLYNVENSIN